MTASTTTTPRIEPADERARRTWDLVASQLDRFRVTRVADVTHLDTLGVPTWMSVRPDSHTFSISQGKGRTPAVARASAVMESLEVWHCERVEEVLPVRRATAAQLGVPYCPEDLPGAGPLAAVRGWTHRWVPARGLVSGDETWVPLDYLDLSLRAQRRPDRAFTASTNGLATALDPADATRHALLEVVERHAVHPLARLTVTERRHLDLDGLGPGAPGDLVRRVRAGGCWVEVALLPRTWGLATAVAYVWSETLPLVVAGSCTRARPAEAVEGALLEAAQSRLAVVTGTREDAPSVGTALPGPAPVTPSDSLHPLPDDTSDERDPLVGLAEGVAELTGHEPVAVDLSHPGTGLCVTRVVAPGLSFDMTENLPRPRTARGRADQGVHP